MLSPVMKRLLEQASHFNFFQAMRILESQFPGSSRLGTGDPLRGEAIRVETHNSLAFPAADVAALLPPKRFQSQREDLEKAQGKELNLEHASVDLDLQAQVLLKKEPARLLVTFMGLYGVSSPLPSYFVDPITLRRLDYFELKKFVDYFGHRLYSLFYRAWKKYRHPLQFGTAGTDGTTLRLAALTGQWPRPHRSGTHKGRSDGVGNSFIDARRIPFARFLSGRVRSANSLEQLLRGYFGFPAVRVISFATAWFDIPVTARLGAAGTTLGAGARMGQRMEDRISSFQVEIGPLPAKDFLALQESLWGESSEGIPLWKQVRDLIEAFLRDPLFFEVRAFLAPGDVIAPGLGESSARLGGLSWVGPVPGGPVSLRF